MYTTYEDLRDIIDVVAVKKSGSYTKNTIILLTKNHNIYKIIVDSTYQHHFC
jgi:uncharacterized membrane protein YukC